MSTYVTDIAEQYFSTLNPIAARIHADISETKNAYEKLWDQLSPKEQSEIIDDSIISPEISLKYGIQDSKTTERPQSYGQKIIHDDQILYRDEFSAPFSYKTQSQMDLRVFSDAPVLPGSPMLKSQMVNKPVLKRPDEIYADNINLITDDKYDAVSNIACTLSDSMSKNSSPTEMMNETPSDTSQDEKTCLLSDPGVMKTGYDFLDNW